MNFNPISFAWGFLQIALLCSVVLTVAWSQRGRHPQLLSSVLAGTCIASLLLALVSIVPMLQWTLATDDAHDKATSSAAIASTHAPPPPAMLQPSAVGSDGSQRDLPPSRDSQDPSHTHGRATVPISIEALRAMVTRYLQRVDHEVRDAELWQRPVAGARNASLTLVGITGLIGMTLLWCSSWFYMHRVLRCSYPVCDEQILHLVAVQSRDFGLNRTPRVRESKLVPIGATVGWQRITVLLHSDWREWSAEERTAVIAHELAHAARHDFVWVILAGWTRIALFFHPMVHALIHRLRLEQELAADQLAAGKVGSAKAYGRALASLALRSQQSLGTSNARLSSMLAAGQICVTRRILMLRQGSLKPIPSRSRWSIWAMAAIACTAIPIAGLRGTTQEPAVERNPLSDSPTERKPDEWAHPGSLSKEFLAAYPPVELVGTMVYRPGRFRGGEFGPDAAWIQEWFAISVLGKPMPDRATVYGECKGLLQWTDEERRHGSFALAAGFREGESTLPGQLSKLADPFRLPVKKMRTVSTKQIAGRSVHGVTNSESSDEPEKWLIDDENGYFLGTHEQAIEFAQGQKFAMESVPRTFHEDYQNAAFGVVFDHCDLWPNKLDAFYKGSPREKDFQLFGFNPQTFLFNDLLKLGIFADGCKSPACSVRAILRDEQAATRMVAQMKTLIEIGKAAFSSLPSDDEKVEAELASSILNTMQIHSSGSEVVLQFDLMVPSLVEGPLSAFRTTAGWLNINADTQCETLGSVTIKPTIGFSSTPSIFGQTLDATDYRGQTVLLELELQCNPNVANEAGALVWASRHEHNAASAYSGQTPRQLGSPFAGHRVLQAKTMAADGSSSWSDACSAERRPHAEPLLPDAPLHKLAILYSVPDDAEHLSFGCYSKNSEVRIRNVVFRHSPQRSQRDSNMRTAVDATGEVECNVLVVPGYPIRKSPWELNFEQSIRKSTEFADQSHGSLRR